MENDLFNDIMTLWVFYYSSAALVGSFIGTMIAFGIRALFRKLTKRG